MEKNMLIQKPDSVGTRYVEDNQSQNFQNLSNNSLAAFHALLILN